MLLLPNRRKKKRFVSHLWGNQTAQAKIVLKDCCVCFSIFFFVVIVEWGKNIKGIYATISKNWMISFIGQHKQNDIFFFCSCHRHSDISLANYMRLFWFFPTDMTNEVNAKHIQQPSEDNIIRSNCKLLLNSKINVAGRVSQSQQNNKEQSSDMKWKPKFADTQNKNGKKCNTISLILWKILLTHQLKDSKSMSLFFFCFCFGSEKKA